MLEFIGRRNFCLGKCLLLNKGNWHVTLNNAKLLGVFQTCLVFNVFCSARINFKYQFGSKLSSEMVSCGAIDVFRA